MADPPRPEGREAAMELGELSALFRQWADVLDGKVEGVRAETMPDGRTVTSIDLPVQGLTREGVGLIGALAHLAVRTHEADPSKGPHTLSIRHVTSAPKAGSPMANGVSTTVPASPRGSGWRSGSEAKLHPTGYASALEAVMSSEDLIDHLLPFLDVFMLGTVMQINRQWKRVAMRDAHWEDRIGGFLCNRTFQADAREVMRPTQLWSWYSRMERSWKEFDTRAVLPERPGQYEEVYAWLSVMINDSSETDWDLQPLAGKVVPLGDGSLLSGGVAVSFSDEDSWELECEGSTPLEALRSYFAEEGGRELLVDLWLMDTGKEKCALAARDWGRTLVTPASEEEEWEAAQGVEEPSREPASPDDFLIKNDNDTCRVYSNGEVHIVLHSTLTLTRLSSIPPPDSACPTQGPPTDNPPTAPHPPTAPTQGDEAEGDEQGDTDSSQEEGADGGDTNAPQAGVVDLTAVAPQPLHIFRVSRMVLKTCLGLGSADKGVEEVEPEHAEELHRSVLRLAHLLH